MARRWAKHTPRDTKLPEKVEKTAGDRAQLLKLAIAIQQQQMIPGAPPVPRIAPTAAPPPGAGQPQPGGAAPQPAPQQPPALPGDPNRPPANNAEAVVQREEQKRKQTGQAPMAPQPVQPNNPMAKIACLRLRRDLMKVAAAAITDPEKVRAALADPEVQAYVDEERRRKDTARKARSWLLPGLGAAGLGAGYGLKRLGDAAFTPTDRQALDDFFALGNRTMDDPSSTSALKRAVGVDAKAAPGLENSDSLWMDYIDRASRAAQTKPYGRNVPDLVMAFRKAMGNNPLLGVSPTPDGERHSREHYDAFAKGPIPAYVHQYHKHVSNPGARDFLFAPQLGKADGNQFENLDFSGLPKSTVDAWHKAVPTPESRPQVQDFYEGLRGGLDKYLQTNHGAGLDQIHTKLNHGQQLAALRGFEADMAKANPTGAAIKNVVDLRLANSQVGPIRQYGLFGGTAAKLLQDVPRYAGYAAMGAGAAGLGYWALKRFQASRDAKKKLRAPTMPLKSPAPTMTPELPKAAALSPGSAAVASMKPRMSKLDIDDLFTTVDRSHDRPVKVMGLASPTLMGRRRRVATLRERLAARGAL